MTAPLVADPSDLYERAPCGLCAFAADGAVLSMNATGRTLLGLPVDASDVRRHVQSFLAPAAIAAFELQLARLLQGGEADTLETEFLLDNRSRLPVWIHITACRGTRGEFLYGRAGFVGLPRRPGRTGTSRAGARHYRAVVEHQTELIARFRPDGRLTFVNAAYAGFVGRSPESLIGEAVVPMPPRAVLGGLTPAKPTAIIENEVMTPGGDARWLHTVYQGLFAERGRLREIQCVGRDITDRKVVESTLAATHDLLEQRVRERTAQLRRMAVDASAVEERERQAIARDLHDDLGQTLHVAKIKLDLLAKALPDGHARELAGTIDALLRTASARVRSLTSQLSPPVLTTMGLAPALRWLAEEMQRDYGLEVEILDDGVAKPLPDPHAAIVFRSVRELLINVARHAGVGRASVDLHVAAGHLVLNVEDAGVGIAYLAQALGRGTGFGLAAIRERLASLEGETRIVTAPATGTRVELRVPLSPAGEG